jgi:predicted molibdopterin-dependent oxidoreductase YjgC
LIKLSINSKQIEVEDGTTVAAAILLSDIAAFRRSVNGDSRGPLCGMGICFECRVTINGIAHQRSCNVLAAEGMEVVTDE